MNIDKYFSNSTKILVIMSIFSTIIAWNFPHSIDVLNTLIIIEAILIANFFITSCFVVRSWFL